MWLAVMVCLEGLFGVEVYQARVDAGWRYCKTVGFAIAWGGHRDDERNIVLDLKKCA